MHYFFLIHISFFKRKLVFRIEPEQLVLSCASSLSAGGLSLQPNFQKGGGLKGPQFLEGGCWEREGWLFSGGGGGGKGGLQLYQQK